MKRRSFLSMAALVAGAGLTGGTPFASLAQGGISVEPSILRRSVTQVAPEPIWFRAAISGQDATGPVRETGATYDPRLHDCYYFWDFYAEGPDNSYTFKHPVNVLSQHMNSRRDYGPVVAHVYRTPGTYKVECLVIEPSSGKTGRGSVEVTINDADEFFSDKLTIYVDPVGGGVPPRGATVRRFTELNQALNEVSGQEVTNFRIMLANTGGRFTFNTGKRFFGLNAKVPTVHIVGQTGGVRPKVELAGGLAWNDESTAFGIGQKDLVIQGIDFKGPFDTANPAGNAGNLVTVYSNGPNVILFDDVSVDGAGICYLTASGRDFNHRSVCVNDCFVTSWRTYGMLMFYKSGIAVLGSAFHQKPYAFTDATDSGGSCIRLGETCDDFHMFASSFFARTSKDGAAGGSIAYLQTANALRLATQNTGGAIYNEQCCYAEGGNAQIEHNPSGGGTGPTSGPINCIIDKCITVGDAHSEFSIQTYQGGTSIRNCLMIQPAITGNRVIENINPRAFISFVNRRGTEGDNHISPMKAYNNTCVYRRKVFHQSGRQIPLISNQGKSPYLNVSQGNNLTHQTDTATPDISFSPLADDRNFIKPFNTGYETIGFRDNQSAPVPRANLRADSNIDRTEGLLATYAPEAGSPAIGGARGHVPPDDATGALRSEIRKAAGLSRTADTVGWLEVPLER